MIEQPSFNALGTAERSLYRGVVVIVADEHHAVVLLSRGEDEWLVSADLLVTSPKPVRLRVGDNVLCVLDDDDPERGFILGRIGPSAAVTEAPEATEAPSEPAARQPLAPPAEAPDTLVIEAKHSLTLRVGEGSITIREDGKILIKGRDLVSHAQRANRIKGGSVAIN